MNDRGVALVALTGAVILAIADAPDWRVETFAGWLGGMTGVAFLTQINPGVGQAMGGLMLAAVVLRRGAEVSAKVADFVNRRTV